MAQYKFWLGQESKFVKVEDEVKKVDQYFRFIEGNKYSIEISQPCKVIEKRVKPTPDEGLKVDYFIDKPKMFTYVPESSKGDFYILSENFDTCVTVSDTVVA